MFNHTIQIWTEWKFRKKEILCNAWTVIKRLCPKKKKKKAWIWILSKDCLYVKKWMSGRVEIKIQIKRKQTIVCSRIKEKDLFWMCLYGQLQPGSSTGDVSTITQKLCRPSPHHHISCCCPCCDIFLLQGNLQCLLFSGSPVKAIHKCDWQ